LTYSVVPGRWRTATPATFNYSETVARWQPNSVALKVAVAARELRECRYCATTRLRLGFPPLHRPLSLSGRVENQMALGPRM